MPTVATAVARISPPARSWAVAGGVHITAPPRVHLPDVDDPDMAFWVANHWCDRLAELTTARMTSPLDDPLNDARTTAVAFSIDDPGRWALTLADGGMATTETADVEIHIYRKGAIVGQFCIPRDALTIDGQQVTMSLVDLTWYLQQRRLGNPQPFNHADPAHWDGQNPSDGLFNASLSGWAPFGGASAYAVVGPSIDVFAPYTARVTAPLAPVPHMGLSKMIDATQTVHGQKWRLIARNFHPSDQPEFLEETVLQMRYHPPGGVPGDWVARHFDPATDPHPRDQWVTWMLDIDVPVNSGGQLEILLMAPEAGHTFWGSRWTVIRENVFGTVDLDRGDLPASVNSRVVGALALPGDAPYRNLHADPSSPLGLRVKPRYPDVEAHSPYDVIQTTCRDSGTYWWWDETPRRRSLITGDRTVTRWEWPITLDDPSGRLTAWENDATQARNRIRVQDEQVDWWRDQQAVISAQRPGAVLDEVVTAPRQMPPVELFMTGATRLTWREHTPDFLTGSLPGDAIHEINKGDLHPVAVELGGGSFRYSSLLLRSVRLSYDQETDRVSVQVAPWKPVEALGG